MGTTADKLQKIINTKAAIKEVANQHGAEITDDTPFSEYGGKIDAVCKAAFDNGAEKEWSDFWDVFQDYGNRSNYRYAFSFSTAWNAATIKPKYDITPRVGGSGDGMYYMFNNNRSEFDLAEVLKNCGVKLDTSKCNQFFYAFYQCNITHIPEIDTRTASTLARAFGDNSTLHTIDKIILKDDGSQNLANMADKCNALENITFEGTIGTSLNLQWSPLSVASMKNIIAHLKNYIGTENESVNTLYFSDECWANLNADPDSQDIVTQYGSWEDYVQSVYGWTC